MSDFAAQVFFNSFAAKYERSIGGATERIAKHLAALCSPLPEGTSVLDNACGTGLMLDALELANPTTYSTFKISAADYSSAMVDILNAKATAKGWQSLTARAVPGENLDFEADSFDVSFTNFGILFFSDGDAGAAQLYRTLKPGGKAFVTTWQDLGYFGSLSRAVAEISPGKDAIKVPFNASWCSAQCLADVMQKAGFRDVNVHQQESRFLRASIAEGAQSLSEGFEKSLQGPGWGEEEQVRLAEVLARHLKEDETFIVDEETGFEGVKMLAHVAVCTK